MKLWKLGALVATAAILVTACSSSGSTTAPASQAPAESQAAGGGGASKGTVKIGISLPLSGSDLAAAGPARDGALLAIKNAGAIDGWTIETTVLDHAVNGVHDPQQGAKDMQTLASDSAVVGVVGPFNSSVAKAQIPVSNEAGLLQCSPANTNPDLTKGDAGKQLRQANPDKINYIRVAATDDIQGPAVAQFGIQNLGLKKVFIIDDTETYGKGLADNFAKPSGTKEGGTVVGREGAPKGTTDYLPILTKAASLSPDSVFYGGVTSTGGGLVRKQMPQAGLGALPYMGGDGIQDGPGSTDGSFINIAGASAANSYSSVAAIHDIPNEDQFVRRLQGRLRRRARRLRRLRLRLRPGHPRRDQARRGRRHRGPRGGPRRRGRSRRQVRHGPRADLVRQRRRHQPARHLPLQGRHGRRRRQGRLGLREADRLQVVDARSRGPGRIAPRPPRRIHPAQR